MGPAVKMVSSLGFATLGRLGAALLLLALVQPVLPYAPFQAGLLSSQRQLFRPSPLPTQAAICARELMIYYERVSCTERRLMRMPLIACEAQGVEPQHREGAGQQSAPKRLPPGGASSFWDKVVASQKQRQESPQKTEVLQIGATREHTATVNSEFFEGPDTAPKCSPLPVMTPSPPFQVIFVHGGEGDSAQGWARAAERFRAPWVKFLLPIGLADAPEQDCAAAVLELVEAEVEAGTAARRIVLAGFGSGGQARPQGPRCCSPWLLQRALFAAALSPSNIHLGS
jgi:hypothetical protein